MNARDARHPDAFACRDLRLYAPCDGQRLLGGDGGQVGYLRRIATAVGVCVVFGALAATPSALATKTSLALITQKSKVTVPVGAQISLALPVTDKITTKTGTVQCESPTVTGRVTADGGASVQIELTRPAEQRNCHGLSAMPWAAPEYLWVWGVFPFNHSFGTLSLKPKGKTEREGPAELIPSPGTDDDITFAATEGGFTRECSYTIKKLKGLWFAGSPAPVELNKGDKMKLDGSENEPLCQKTATIPIGLNLEMVSGASHEFLEVRIV